mmetsp:Transcript_57096/g.113415  ORF Transcript_57096/g.113415 Transcript_57096/m.113415 type:complete len:228 (-) Transcript_57096:314-997(-)
MKYAALTSIRHLAAICIHPARTYARTSPRSACATIEATPYLACTTAGASEMPPGRPAGTDWKRGCAVIGLSGCALTTRATGMRPLPCIPWSNASFRSAWCGGTSLGGPKPTSGEVGAGAAPGMTLGERTKPASKRCGSTGWKNGIVLLYGGRFEARSASVDVGAGMMPPLETISRSVACTFGGLTYSFFAISRALPQALWSGLGRYVLSMLPAETTPDAVTAYVGWT